MSNDSLQVNLVVERPMRTTFHVRKAVSADAAEIARLSEELGYPTSVTQISTRLAVLLPLASQFIAVAVGLQQLLGWVAAERRVLLASGEKAELLGLIVDRQARRIGVGKALVLAAEHWASAQGLQTMVVRSNIIRAESHPFYESIGYVRKKTQHTYVKVLATTELGL